MIYPGCDSTGVEPRHRLSGPVVMQIQSLPLVSAASLPFCGGGAERFAHDGNDGGFRVAAANLILEAALSVIPRYRSSCQIFVT